MTLSCSILIKNKSSYSLDNPKTILGKTTQWAEKVPVKPNIYTDKFAVAQIVAKSYDATSIDGTIIYDIGNNKGTFNQYIVNCKNSNSFKEASSNFKKIDTSLISTFKCKVGQDNEWMDNECNSGSKDQDMYVQFILVEASKSENKNTTHIEKLFNSETMESECKQDLIDDFIYFHGAENHL